MLAAVAVSYVVDGRHLVRNVHLNLEPGTFIALLGPNGAGKSTLLRLLAGDLQPTAGEVLLDGRPLSAYSAAELALRRAVMPQSTFLSFAFTAAEVVSMGRHPHAARRGPAQCDEAVVRRSMETTETAPLARRRFPTLSGGEQSRVTLARVLAQEAPIVLLDEPTSHLDPRHQHLVMGVARHLARQGYAVLAVLHDLNLAALYADRVAVMDRGELRVCAEPAQALRADLLAEVFQCPFLIEAHPRLARPLVLTLPSGTSAQMWR